MGKQITIIGSGFSSVAAACYLAHSGYEVCVYEKNDTLGGRARQYIHDGFKFDMGPTWYWMPDVFERFFNDFDKSPDQYYRLEKLSPAYRIYFGENDFIDISDDVNKICEEFEKREKGAAEALKIFLAKASSNYDIAIKDLVYKPGESPLELVTKKTILEIDQFIKTIRSDVYKRFNHPHLRQTLEFPVLFLGAKPSDTPAFYNFMNHADFGLGTWYPKGGMRSVIEGMVRLAKELGVTFETNSPVHKIDIDEHRNVKHIEINGDKITSDVVLSGADYQHTETLLNDEFRSYKQKFWNSRTMAPSSLLFYVGFDKKLKNVLHHTLFFDTDFDTHAKDIYDNPKWPEKPLFYASFPSISDESVAPAGKECATFLIPLAAADIEDTDKVRNKYFDIIIKRLEHLTGQDVKNSIIFKKSYCLSDFKKDYNSFKGNAYGMANTLFQTAFLRPKLKSKKVRNLYYTGQLTVPGPGVPPALISGKIVSEMIIKNESFI